MANNTTKDAFEQLLASLTIDASSKRTLELIKAYTIPISHTLTYKDGKVWSSGTQSYESPFSIAPPNDTLVFSKPNGSPYTSARAVYTALNDLLKTLLNDDKATWSSIRALYKNKDTPPITLCYVVDQPSKLVPVDLTSQEYKFDAQVIKALKGFGVYVSQNQLDDGKLYPFLPIHIKSLNKHIRYDLYKYAAQLPWYVRLSEKWRLPTVDHISRDTRDNRYVNMRYCTHTQNMFNKCNSVSSAKYHYVSASDVLTCAPRTDDEKAIVDHTLFWFNMLSKYMPLKSNNAYKSYYKENPFDLEGCCKKKHLTEWKEYTNFLGDFVCEILDWDSSTWFIDKLDVSKDTIPKPPKKSRILNEIYAALPDNVRVNRFIRPDYLCALAGDVSKVKMNGSFAHTNFLKIPKAIPMRKPTKLQSPIDVLNKFEHYKDDGIGTILQWIDGEFDSNDFKDMKIQYNMETDHETGKQMIVTQFVNEKPQCDAGELEFLEGIDVRRCTITQPFCAYPLNVE
jgi:hypothetical protein